MKKPDGPKGFLNRSFHSPSGDPGTASWTPWRSWRRLLLCFRHHCCSGRPSELRPPSLHPRGLPWDSPLVPFSCSRTYWGSSPSRAALPSAGLCVTSQPKRHKVVKSPPPKAAPSSPPSGLAGLCAPGPNGPRSCVSSPYPLLSPWNGLTFP